MNIQLIFHLCTDLLCAFLMMQSIFSSYSCSIISVLYRHLKLTAEQKCDIATRELEELREEIERMKEESDKILDDYRVCYSCFLH